MWSIGQGILAYSCLAIFTSGQYLSWETTGQLCTECKSDLSELVHTSNCILYMHYILVSSISHWQTPTNFSTYSRPFDTTILVQKGCKCIFLCQSYVNITKCWNVQELGPKNYHRHKIFDVYSIFSYFWPKIDFIPFSIKNQQIQNFQPHSHNQ